MFTRTGLRPRQIQIHPRSAQSRSAGRCCCKPDSTDRPQCRTIEQCHCWRWQAKCPQLTATAKLVPSAAAPVQCRGRLAKGRCGWEARCQSRE